MEKSTPFIIGAILLSGMMISTAILMSRGNIEEQIRTELQRQLQGQEPELVEGGDLSLAIAEDDPYQGDADTATFAIIEFSDYECPFCERFHNDARPQLIEEYVETGQAIMIWKDLPLPFYEPINIQQAQAAHCVWDQTQNDGYFAFNRALFDLKKDGGEVEESDLNGLAEQIEGLDQDEFAACYESEVNVAKVQRNQEDASSVGVNGTPGIIIGRIENGQVVDGIRLAGALPFDVFQEVIEDYLN